MSQMQIPLQSVPNQSVSFMLNSIPWTLQINTRRGNLYIDVIRDGVAVINGRALKSYAPIGYGIIMIDTLGMTDPNYEQLGSRYILMIDDANNES